MLKKMVIAGAAAATVLGAGTAALAVSGSSSSPTSPAASSPSAGKAAPGANGQAKRRPGLNLARRALHATWVTRNGSSGFVTHDAIRGQVTAVSTGSITVKAADDVSQTYAVTGDTKVHLRSDGKGKAGSIGEVKTGDRVIVLGTGTTSLTATQVLDGAK
ncbi:MAG TPA: hypothetical protein VFU36_12025 [Jatrophihabitans sp.]|nr:hypothetical protein [Jatrophihabitans sp.]